jgi:hypothetical protein
MPEQLIGGSALSDAQTWANTLITDITSGTYKSQAASWIDGDDISDVVTTATRWATDANTFVCSVVMPNGAAALQTGDLYPTYYNSAIGTIELQIAKAGYRLGNWLNTIYSTNVASKKMVKRIEVLPDLTGRDVLPEPRPMSRAKLARAAMQGSCCGVRGAHSH